MRYYKNIIDGYIVAIGTGVGGTEITEDEYNNIANIIKNKPTTPPKDGYRYRLNELLEWVVCEVPIYEDIEEVN